MLGGEETGGKENGGTSGVRSCRGASDIWPGVQGAELGRTWHGFPGRDRPEASKRTLDASLTDVKGLP